MSVGLNGSVPRATFLAGSCYLSKLVCSSQTEKREGEETGREEEYLLWTCLNRKILREKSHVGLSHKQTGIILRSPPEPDGEKEAEPRRSYTIFDDMTTGIIDTFNSMSVTINYDCIRTDIFQSLNI